MNTHHYFDQFYCLVVELEKDNYGHQILNNVIYSRLLTIQIRCHDKLIKVEFNLSQCYLWKFNEQLWLLSSTLVNIGEKCVKLKNRSQPNSPVSRKLTFCKFYIQLQSVSWFISARTKAHSIKSEQLWNHKDRTKTMIHSKSRLRATIKFN